MEELRELLQFLDLNQRLDLKAVALSHVLSLTGSAEGRKLILEFPELMQAVVKLTTDKTHTIAKDATLALINLTGDESGAVTLHEACQSCPETSGIIPWSLEQIVDEKSKLADPWCMVLSNLSRAESLSTKVLDEIDKDEKLILLLANAFSRIGYNKEAKLHYIASIFCNLTQSSRGRKLLCESKHNLLQKLLPFISYQDNIIRRGGIIGVLKNICFDPVYHDILLKDHDGILCSLLTPLAGPEEFTEEENDKLPVELQYLGEDKLREEDPDLRKMLLESLLQLCATKKYREFLRSKGTYEILREYHKWEAKVGGDREALLACENVVDILIRKEDEIGVDNIRDVDIPSHLGEKFIEDDKNFIEDK
ncbi:unnamed protein product [Hermetia illucens]|uniref:Protein HGH1 homolog n=1 Tax=Hermetia illucens TaxID=343691 RepID=A0A7R8V5W6_HERIL|nr:protein HGH1 homolog [Hermetia illucens]CAD7092692.1 unnamed protein product [Hermetia illucens]